MVPRLLERYKKEIVPKMMEESGLKNSLAIARLDKIVVNMGVGEGIQDIKILERSMEELMAITGQRPLMRKAKKAISNFKIKEGSSIGCKVTLRRAMMYEFMDRLINVALPRIRDFRGVSAEAFDKEGNYTLGLTEQTIFPEIEYDKIARPQGMDITFVFKHSKGAEESRRLLKHFGMPFRTKE